MLYVFNVPTGYMMTFDAKLAFDSVSKLKEEIEKQCNIRAVHQVLLMSGGACLESHVRISSYSTGTDTNPVYLFSKKVADDNLATSLSFAAVDDFDETTHDMQNQVLDSSNMPNDYKTLIARNEMAQEFYAIARTQTTTCENLVKEQHYQHQGWTTIIAYFENLVHNCCLNAEILDKNYRSFLAERQQNQNTLNNLDHDIEILKTIPILPGLVPGQTELKNSSSFLMEDSIGSMSQSQDPTLLNWLTTERLKHMAGRCSRGLERFSDNLFRTLSKELLETVGAANEKNLKEIHQVCERLSKLENLMNEIKKLVKKQGEIAEYFEKDYERISLIKYKEIFDESWISHNDYMIIMNQNNSHLRSIWKSCFKSKKKLCSSIQRRLERIMEIEGKLAELDEKMVLYNDGLTRLCKDFQILRQVHLAPELYTNAVVEVVRRKNYSQTFLNWSRNMVCEMQSLHSQELSRRKEFHRKFDGHFLNELFFGFEDNPPPFATKAPPLFDNRLPELTVEDIRTLQDVLPTLNFSFSLPNSETTDTSFSSKGTVESNDTENVCIKLNNLTVQSNKQFENVDQLHEAHSDDYNLQIIIESVDESFKSRIRKICEERQGIHVVDEFELLDFKNVMQLQEDKIKSLKSLIEEKENMSKNHHLLEVMKQKLLFTEEHLEKLKSIYSEIEERKKEARAYQEKLQKEKSRIKVLENLFKNSLDKYDKKSKELYGHKF